MPGTIWPKIMLIGRNGQVGWELTRTLLPLGEVIPLGRKDLDLTDRLQICRWVRELKPALIVNAAAYTAVDRAEEEPELAMCVNGIAPGVLAEEATKVGSVLVHYSTDYVFDGVKGSSYNEEDQPSPINVYGHTKLESERRISASDVPHLILRVSWVYGQRGRNFFVTILRLARERDEVRVISDQVGAPTWSRQIAEATAQILAQGREKLVANSGVYHLTAAGETTWYGFARAILEKCRMEGVKVLPISSAEYPAKARRPIYSVLSNAKLRRTFGIELPPWSEMLGMVMEADRKGFGRTYNDAYENLDRYGNL